MMNYVSKVHLAEDWLFLSRVVVHKLENVQGSWGETKCKELERKIVDLALTGFQEVSDVPQWKEYRELKTSQAYRNDSDETLNDLKTVVEDRLNLLGNEPILPEDRKLSYNRNMQ